MIYVHTKEEMVLSPKLKVNQNNLFEKIGIFIANFRFKKG